MPRIKQRVTTSDAPDGLRPYVHHGMDLEIKNKHGVGDCPLCGSEGKFSADCESGLWRCWVCGGGAESGGGNALTFLRCLYNKSVEFTDNEFLKNVKTDRKLCHNDAASAWGICQSPIPPHPWLIPGFGPDGTLDQLYKRTHVQGSDGQWSWRLLPTPNVWPEGYSHALHAPSSDFDPDRPNIVVCEGLWDGMALWEVLSEEMGDCNVIAVPGCNVWRDEWSELCRGKNVTIMFDSDHPRKVGIRAVQPGKEGVQRIAKRLSGIALSVSWLKWGPDGYDSNKSDGWDVRDALSAGASISDRKSLLNDLLKKIEHVPQDWFSPSAPHVGNGKHHGGSVESKPCHSWIDLESAWDTEKGGPMRWRPDISQTLAVLLAVCASTRQSGNQLFLQCVGAAGSGKTTLCEGLLVSRHCHHLEHITGFHSGWKNEDGKDCSLIARINNKTLITPEADIMMSSPRFQEIMSQQRRIFDGKSGATYKNSPEDTLYVGLRTPWIMAGTPALMDTDQSRLGDRFLRVIINDPGEDEKREILRAALRGERSAMLETANGTAGGIVDPKTRLAHALTGGYVDWLRANVEQELSTVESSVSNEVEDACIDLAELSADLRARPNRDKRKEEVHDSKELPTRLARQNIRLACHLAVVMNKSSVDKEVLDIVRKVALDTAHGHSLNIARWLCSQNPKGHGSTYQETGGISQIVLTTWCGMKEDKTEDYLMFLRKIGVLELRRPTNAGPMWLLTPRTYELYMRIMGRGK